MAAAAVAPASSVMPSCRSVSESGSSPPVSSCTVPTRGVDLGADRRGGSGVVEPAQGHTGDGDAVADAAPRERLYGHEAGDREHDDEQRGRHPYVASVPGAEPPQRTSA